jgi:hypothetical protein
MRGARLLGETFTFLQGRVISPPEDRSKVRLSKSRLILWRSARVNSGLFTALANQVQPGRPERPETEVLDCRREVVRSETSQSTAAGAKVSGSAD